MEVYMGSIVIWPIRYAPQDTMGCFGQQLLVQQYSALYALLGVTYGGNGATNFNLPNLVNRVPLGSVTLGGGGTAGSLNAANGATGGSYHPTSVVNSSASFQLQANQLPGHTHTANFTPVTGNQTVTVSAPAANIPVTIPVGTTTPSGPPPQPLTGSVYLTNMAAGNALRGPYSTTAPAANVSLIGATASGNPGGSFSGNVSTVTGGTVTVASNNPSAPANVNISTVGQTQPLPLPPYLALSFIMVTAGTWPPNPN